MKTNQNKCPSAVPGCASDNFGAGFGSRAAYYSMRSLYRRTRRRLSTDEHAFSTCTAINSALRDLTGKWDTGVCTPTPWENYRRRGYRDVLFVSLSLQRWLKVNA